MKELAKLISLVVILLAIVAAVLVLFPRPPAVNIDEKTTKENIEYGIVTIEGMPCLVIQSTTYYGYTVQSATCDWSKWDGNK